MAITPPQTEAPLSYSALDIINDAMIEVGIKAPGEPVDPDVGQWSFRKLNYQLDTWAAEKKYVYASTFNTYTLVPGLSPHTIGPAPGATYSTPQRPVRVEAATLVLNNVTPNVETPIAIRDKQWWMENSIKTLQSSIPTDLFYNPAFPNGELYFWPVPNTSYLARLQLWQLFSQFSSITDPIGGPGGENSLVPGYRNAMMLTLAEYLQPGSARAGDLTLTRAAANARAAVWSNNYEVPRMQTRDSGCPGADQELRSTTFNYKNRSF